MVILMLALIVGSMYVFTKLPNFKNSVTEIQVSEQKTVYSDDKVNFVGMEDLSGLEDISSVKIPESVALSYAEDLKYIISKIHPDAEPKAAASLCENLSFYSFGNADVPEEPGEESEDNRWSHRHRWDSEDNILAEPNAGNFTSRSSGILLVAKDAVYTGKDGKQYRLSVCSCEDDYYYFCLREDRDSVLSSEDFYSAISALDVSLWNEAAIKAEHFTESMKNEYLSGSLTTASEEYYTAELRDSIDNQDVEDVFIALCRLSLSLDESYQILDSYTFAGKSMPEFTDMVARSLSMATSKTLDGSTIIVENEDEIITGVYHLGYIYDLYTGSIVGFGLCR